MDKIKDKVRKLLAMADDNRGNEHEQERAMERASALMMQHGIKAEDVIEAKPQAGYGRNVAYHTLWERNLAWAAAHLYGARYVYNGLWINFAGREDNRDAALDTYEWLVQQVEAAYKNDLPRGLTKQARADYRRNYKLACVQRINARVTKIVREQSTQGLLTDGVVMSTALVVVNHRKELNDEIDALFAEKKVKTSKSKQKGPNYASAGALDGHAAGDNIKLYKEIE